MPEMNLNDLPAELLDALTTAAITRLSTLTMPAWQAREITAYYGAPPNGETHQGWTVVAHDWRGESEQGRSWFYLVIERDGVFYATKYLTAENGEDWPELGDDDHVTFTRVMPRPQVVVGAEYVPVWPGGEGRG